MLTDCTRTRFEKRRGDCVYLHICDEWAVGVGGMSPVGGEVASGESGHGCILVVAQMLMKYGVDGKGTTTVYASC